MKLSVFSAVAVLAAIGADAATPTPTPSRFAPDCTQNQRQVVNALLRQDVNPAKACYTKAKGDITQLSTSRLCPIEQCKVWLEFMAEKSPDCVYDDINYGREYKAKYADCLDPSAGSGSNGTPKPTSKKPVTSSSESSSSSISGSGSGSIEEPTPEPATEEPSNSDSGSFEIETPEVTTPTVNFPEETPETSRPSSATSAGVAVCVTAVAAIATGLMV